MSAGAWARLQQRYCVTLLKLIFFTADTATVRLILAGSSFFFALSLIYHATMHTGLFARPAYALMAQVGNEWLWAGAFALHAAGGFWRLVDAQQRDRWGIAVNSFGFLVWLYSTVCMNLALGVMLPSSAPEWALIFASGWALYRTGWNERVSA